MLSTSQFKPLDYLYVSPVSKPCSSSSSSASSSPTSMKKFTRVVSNLVVTQLSGTCRAVSHVQYKLLGKLKEVEFTDYLKQPVVMWKVMNKKRRSSCCCKSKYQVKNMWFLQIPLQLGLFSRTGRSTNRTGSVSVPPHQQPDPLRFDAILQHRRPSRGATTKRAGGVPDESSGYLSDYLYWLEKNNVFGGDEDGNCYSDKTKDNNSSSTAAAITTEGKKEDVNELAEKFIGRCHEKLRLEKEESYRMFQEMMDRSL